MVEDYSVCSVSHFVCLRRTLNCRSIEIAMQVEQAVISHVRIHRTEALFYSTMKHNCMTRLTTIATQAVDRIHDCTLKVLRGKFWWLLSTDKVIDIFRWRHATWTSVYFSVDHSRGASYSGTAAFLCRTATMRYWRTQFCSTCLHKLQKFQLDWRTLNSLSPCFYRDNCKKRFMKSRICLQNTPFTHTQHNTHHHHCLLLRV